MNRPMNRQRNLVRQGGRIKTLIPGPSDIGITDIEESFQTARGKGKLTTVTTTRSNPIPFTLVADQPFTALVSNPNRNGLLLQNLDAASALFVGFGLVADFNQLQLAAGGYLLLDFTCPTDAVSLLAAANIQGYLVEFSRVTG